MAERIIDVNIEEQSRLDSQAYAIYVARNRQIPYFIDGLKPVLRKILWCSAHDYGNQGFVKTAKVIGNVIAKYNPHGDSGVHYAIRNMINDFSTKYPTMAGSGSWGSKINPYPAQPRYNECKISQFALDVFIRDIKEDSRSTDWMSNYDNKCLEPVYLPARIPALLVLGQVGIAVGVKCSIPAHNLGEVVDTTIALMKNPNQDIVLIPDECMACELIDTDWKTICDTGTGNYIAQGIVDIGEYDYHKSAHPCLIVRSLPDFTFFDSIEESIRKLVKSGKMPYIIDIISRSGIDMKDPTKYRFEEIIVLKKGTDPEFVREFLYANTAIRQTRQVNLIVIKDNNLKTMNYKEYLLQFIEFRRMSIYRRLNVRLQTLKTKLHETELYIKLLTSGEIDNVIKLIRKNKSDDKGEIVDFLVSKLRVTPIQAKFLANTTLPQLSAGFLKKCQKDREKYDREIKIIIDNLLDSKKLDDIIITEMLEIKNKYNDKRKCKIISKSQAMNVIPGMFKLLFFKNNYIKKINENDNVPASKLLNMNFSMVADNTENIIIFTSIGKAFKIPVSKIQFTEPSSDGIDIRILNKYCTSTICCAARETILKQLSDSKSKVKNYIYILTKNGFIKKIDIQDVTMAPNSGLIYSKVDKNDSVQTVLFGPSKLDLLIYSNNKVLRIPSKEVPYLRRSTKGNKAMNSKDPIDGMNFILFKSTDLIIVTKNGYVNRLPIESIPVTGRGKSGIQVIKLSKNDSIVNIWPCTERSRLIVKDGKYTKELIINSIEVGTTNSTGNKLFEDVSKVTLAY